MDSEDFKTQLLNLYEIQKGLNKFGISTPDELQELINQCEKQYLDNVVIPTLKMQADVLLNVFERDVALSLYKDSDGTIRVVDNNKGYNDDEGESDLLTASRSEMKTEALRRMKEIDLYDGVISAFENDDEPLLYEPPQGASYSLDDEEQSMVATTEENYDILVWGVIKCTMKYNRIDADVYCMLYVGHNKDDWESERENLYSGAPHVFTYMPEYNLKDSGSIRIYKSEGGTLLRRI